MKKLHNLLRELFVVATENLVNLAAGIKNYSVREQLVLDSTHPLEYMPTYPDLSDCETTYVGSDPNRKPSHRLVWRERIPESPDQPIIREVIALGERNAGQAYYLAGQRLGRPVGLTLAELRAQREPIVNPSRVAAPPPNACSATPIELPGFRCPGTSVTGSREPHPASAMVMAVIERSRRAMV